MLRSGRRWISRFELGAATVVTQLQSASARDVPFWRCSSGQCTAAPHLEIVRGDVRDIQSVVRSVKDCGAVIHLAAIVGDPACDASHSLAMEVNRAATRMLLDVSRGYGVSRFLFASTCSVYGASDFLVDERTQPSPISVYARTKVDSEELALGIAGPTFHPTVLRLSTLRFVASATLRSGGELADCSSSQTGQDYHL